MVLAFQPSVDNVVDETLFLAEDPVVSVSVFSIKVGEPSGGALFLSSGQVEHRIARTEGAFHFLQDHVFVVACVTVANHAEDSD